MVFFTFKARFVDSRTLDTISNSRYDIAFMKRAIPIPITKE